MSRWNTLNRQIIGCERCPRLAEYCRRVAAEKRRAFRDEEYWGRPVPNFGDPKARLLIVGLAPAAHGANRTGRMFTGDNSGNWLYRALHKQGFASQPTSARRDDGLELHDCAITAVCHCAPPDNKPSTAERQNCRSWLSLALDAVPATVLVALGQLAWNALITECRERDWLTEKGGKFGHAAEIGLAGGRALLGSYHPSQQNTFTGRLTEPMLDGVFRRARLLLAEA